MSYVSVLLERSIEKALDYSVPVQFEGKVFRGMCVEVPLRTSIARGFVLEVKESAAVPQTKPIHALIGNEPVLNEELFSLALWMASYYVCPLGKVLKMMLPAGVRKNKQPKTQLFVMKAKSPAMLRKAVIEMLRTPQQAVVLETMLRIKKGILLSELLETTGVSATTVKSLEEKGFLRISETRADESPLSNVEYFKTKPKVLRSEQSDALKKIEQTIEQNCFATHLLFGVTGSGKTEVYLQAIEKALSLGKGIIMLVPEIALTAQTIQRFKSRFDVPIAVLHYRLSDGQRLDAWKKMYNGTCPIVIGARSCVFSPVKNLGLIIVDEEHEQSYKQTDDSPCYQARDVAIMRAKLHNACVVLGSATPSIESYQKATEGKYVLSQLTERSGVTLPEVFVVDMRREYEKAKGFTIFSELLLNKIEERKRSGQQSILFLNRRGYHTNIFCTACGTTAKCPHCDISLTSHKEMQAVTCHVCGFTTHPPSICKKCNSSNVIQFRGIGTEKVQAMLHGIFPGIRTIRVDADTTRHKGSVELLFQEFRSGKADVLIGTQMVAKGLHFPEVTLACILHADATINIPDFRSQEMAFQLVTQVAGRSGRGQIPGEVIIQTAIPEHSTMLYAKNQDYEGFFKEEIETRKLFSFPPFSRFVKFLFTGKNEHETKNAAVNYLQTLVSFLTDRFFCHPLMPSGHAKIKDLFRFQFLVRGPSIKPCLRAIEETEKKRLLPSSVNRYIDVDPSSTFF